MKKKYLEGSLLTVGASLWWGVIGVIYFKYVSFANPIELVIHRTIWTAVILVITTFSLTKWNFFFKLFKDIKIVIFLFISGILVLVNWLTWLYAISIDRLVDASFGYYIFPIFSVFFGIIFLKENYNKNKILAVFLVFISILYLLFQQVSFPWIGMTVAITFSVYGLIRKKINIDSDIALLFETLLLSPFAIIAFLYLVKLDLNIFSFSEMKLSFYLLFAGPMTLIPLYLYTKGLQLVGIGSASMIFFATPTAQFLLGTLVYGETLDAHKLISFIFVWIAVFIYLNELRKE
ncbi:EamA family transporter [Pelagibacteraceae bacterium]|nr:EamA family transporter [Pelagibacteraceae bacterium]|tara:strand:- start:750 stop:1622 length:873 start_codon:yes stop_codon:yes gene_type:complete